MTFIKMQKFRRTSFVIDKWLLDGKVKIVSPGGGMI